MDEDIRGGLSRVFWHPGERRLRTPFRLGVALVLLLVVVVFLAVAGSVLGSALSVGPTASALGGPLLAAVLSLAVLGIVWLVDRRRLADLGLAVDGGWARDFLAGLLGGVLMAGSAVGVALATGTGSVAGTLTTSDGALVAGNSLPVGVVVSFVLLLFLAFFEELVFRGYVLVNLAEGLRGFTDDRQAALIAVAASAVLFGLAHAANPGANALGSINVTLFGLLLGSAYVLTDSLALPVGIHTAWNFALGPGFGTPVSGIDSGVALVDVDLDGASLLTGGSFGLEAGVLALVGLAVGSVAVLGWLRASSGKLSVCEQVAQPDLRTRE